MIFGKRSREGWGGGGEGGEGGNFPQSILSEKGRRKKPSDPAICNLPLENLVLIVQEHITKMFSLLKGDSS